MTNEEMREIFSLSGRVKLICRNKDDICLLHVTPENGQPEYYEVRELIYAENKLDDSLELIYTFLL